MTSRSNAWVGLKPLAVRGVPIETVIARLRPQMAKSDNVRVSLPVRPASLPTGRRGAREPAHGLFAADASEELASPSTSRSTRASRSLWSAASPFNAEPDQAIAKRDGWG